MAIHTPWSHPLTHAERTLRKRFSAGEPLRLDGAGWRRSRRGAKPVIHARVIRDLLLSGAPAARGRVQQLKVSGAAISGELDLRFAKIDCPVRLENCDFDGPVRLSEAHLRSVSLRGCSAGEIDASHLTITGDLDLDEAELRGPLKLSGGHLEDDLHLRKVTIGAPRRMTDGGRLCEGSGGNVLLDLENIDVKGKIEAQGLTVYGNVSTKAATVAGYVQMTDEDAGLKPALGAEQGAVAWDGSGMKVGGSLTASGLTATGMVRLVDAQVLLLVLTDAKITNSGTALTLDRLASHGSVFCDGDICLTGGIHAVGMQVGGTLYLGCGLVRAPSQGSEESRRRALDLRRVTITGALVFEDHFRAVGTCDLTGAHISGELALSGASLRSADGARQAAGFIADRAQMDSDLCWKGDVTCQGVMSLRNAHVGGDFAVEQKRRRPQCALVANGLSVARNVSLDVPGTVDLSGAKITGDVTLHTARLSGKSLGSAADLSGITAHVLTLHGRPKKGLVDLTRASVNLLRDDPVHPRYDRPDGGAIVLDGLTYSQLASAEDTEDQASGGGGGPRAPRYTRWRAKGLPGLTRHRDGRLTWLAAGTGWVRAADGQYEKATSVPQQPYRQLAAFYQRAGKDRDARQVLHEMYRTNNNKIKLRDQPLTKVWNGLQNAFLGYGYAPGRALVWILALAALATAWYGLQSTKPTPIGFLRSAILSLAFVLPGSGYDKIEKWTGGTFPSHLIAAGLVIVGLLLGASVIAAAARTLKR